MTVPPPQPAHATAAGASPVHQVRDQPRADHQRHQDEENQRHV
ncbi:Hypothetical protein MIP_02607 [Mycobacterium intracellulare subsp. intracellulare MTCC 9506]|uniref:Uncharacterized protein n=1 Tax=Mycobacterium indicus pranii (strain DSM 45239 / MTCC 9506) TaxID=1232724 RepID=J9W9T5_MYCIP|nr:hypothetical protein OCQ_16040 [Mycobacterium paraintracellulare]AFS13775.1 Hypothetical protein MIP_02607 [Mycobacterium intracellulare subsp. intracellulare MTCC 9506]